MAPAFFMLADGPVDSVPVPLGLMPIVTQEVFRLVEAVNRTGIGVLLVEQNLHQSLRIAHRGYVLEKGSVVLAGTGQELLANDYVRRAFLGH